LPPIRRNLLGGKGFKKYYGESGKLIPVLFGLTQEQLEKLENEAQKAHSGRSNISRKAIDFYWLHTNNRKIIHRPFQLGEKRKCENLGLKPLPVTIRRDQIEWLKSITEITGKSISEVGRNAIEYYFAERECQ
jgi:hypothetical protein